MTSIRVACAFCSWHTEGELEPTLKRQRLHRLREHGLTHARRRRRSRGMTTDYSVLPREQRVEIEEEIARRKRLHGINGEEAA